MGFGLSFGAKKTKTNQTSTVDKTEATNQQQTGTKATSGVTSNTQTGSTVGSSTGQQTNTQTGGSQTQGSTTGTTSQTTSSFKNATLAEIENSVSQLFQTAGVRSPISNFDSEQFVSDGFAAAEDDINAGLESNINQLTTNLGGTANTNSMSALLASRLRNDAAAELQGVRSNLTGQAEQISRDNVLAANTLAATDQGFLGNLLAALKGGVTTTTGQESTQQSQNQTTQNTGVTNTSQQTQEQQAQQSTQTQQLIELMDQLLAGTTRTTGTENIKGVNSSKGGGFSLSL